jgi:MFS transporter, DHA2 family, multidrug resistance protein
VAVAQKLHSASLLASVQTAFVHGMEMALLVSAGIALAGVVLTLIFLPASNAPTPAAVAQVGPGTVPRVIAYAEPVVTGSSGE